MKKKRIKQIQGVHDGEHKKKQQTTKRQKKKLKGKFQGKKETQ